jgi:hypothetical protein
LYQPIQLLMVALASRKLLKLCCHVHFSFRVRKAEHRTGHRGRTARFGREVLEASATGLEPKRPYVLVL